MTIRQALQNAARTLDEAGVPDARADAEWLLAHATGHSRMDLRLEASTELTWEQERHFSSLLLSRAQRLPLQYLLGTQNFYGLPIAVDERALIPRPETEELCQWALSLLQKMPAPCALDLCTGSGAIAIALKHHCPRAQVSASDLSASALMLARENARANGADVRFWEGDLWEPLMGERFDLIVSNPPYIPSDECGRLQAEVLCEPRMALDGGPDGLDFYRRIARGAAAHLNPGGWILLEVGQGEATDVARMLTEAGLSEADIRSDIYGVARMVGACQRRDSHV